MSLFSPCFSCGAKVDDYIYASSFKFNALIKIGIDDAKTEYMVKFPKADSLINNQHSRAYEYNNKIFFCPAFGEYIHIVDMISSNIKAIAIDRVHYKGEYYGLLYEEKIILIPKNIGGDILCFNINSLEISILLKWEIIRNYILENVKYTFLRVTQLDGILYLPIYGTSRILLLDLNSSKFEIKNVYVDNLLGAIGGKNAVFLLSNSNSSVYKWSPVSNEMERCSVDKAFKKDNCYTFAINLNEKTILFPSYSFSYIGYEQGGEIKPLLKLESSDGMLLFLEPFYCDNRVWALPFQGEDILCISDNEIVKKKLSGIEINQQVKIELIRQNLNSGRVLCEGTDFTLDEYIQGLV